MKNRNSGKKPLITVLTTVYNGEKFLRETIESVLNQTFKDFEYVIVNDASTDKTERIIKEFMKKDKRIVYLKTRKNKGFYNLHNVMNKGLEIARGKYIARLDADDICYPQRLRVQHDYLEKHPEIFMIGSSFEVIDENGKVIKITKKRNYPSIFYKIYVAFSNSFCHSSIMFRNEGLKYPNENEHHFYFYMLYHGKKIKNIPNILVKYRINPYGMMSQHADLSRNPYKKLYKGI